MSTYGSRLQAALERKKASRADLAKAIGRTPQAVGQVINGSTKALTAENNSLAAIYLGVNSHWLATGEGEMTPKEGKVEASNLMTLQAPAQCGLTGALTEVQAAIDRLSPLLQDAARVVLGKWLNGQASLADVVATIEGMQQIRTGPMPGTENRAA